MDATQCRRHSQYLTPPSITLPSISNGVAAIFKKEIIVARLILK
uniref:Uncharacterized protein n=1 Tax=Anguilla anguilla TaxID=7936 RepID=A0A0E9VTU4_ANGAN